MRIDKYICDSINITRTQVKQKIAKGCVYADGERVRSSSQHVDEKKVTVTLDGVLVPYNKFVYIMMNKPAGVISASSDKKCMTAIDLLSDADKRKDLFVAGRLDKDTTGFLLITNDGDFAHSILSPKNSIYKTYIARLRHGDVAGYREAFESGVVIDGEHKCRPARFEYLGNNECSLEICEGKFHQVKKMFLSLGNEVVSLRRVKISDVCLDTSLKEGEYRRLFDEEFEIFMNKIHKNTP